MRQVHDVDFLCVDCGFDTLRNAEYYMVRNQVWHSAGMGAGMLCIGCLEARIGRPLVRGDFAEVPVNSLPCRRSARLIDRLATVLCLALALILTAACAPIEPSDLYPELAWRRVTTAEMAAVQWSGADPSGCPVPALASATFKQYREITGSFSCADPRAAGGECSWACTLSDTQAGDLILWPPGKPLADVLNHEMKHVWSGCTTGDYDGRHLTDVWQQK